MLRKANDVGSVLSAAKMDPVPFKIKPVMDMHYQFKWNVNTVLLQLQLVIITTVF